MNNTVHQFALWYTSTLESWYYIEKQSSLSVFLGLAAKIKAWGPLCTKVQILGISDKQQNRLKKVVSMVDFVM